MTQMLTVFSKSLVGGILNPSVNFIKLLWSTNQLMGLLLIMCSMFLDRDSVTNYPLRDTEGKLAIPICPILTF